MNPSDTDPDSTVHQQARPDAPAFGPGARVGPYRLLKFLGRGAFGEVWLAELESTVARVPRAVKLPLHATPDVLKAMTKEAAVWLQAAGHPNVLPLLEADAHDGRLVLASEYAPDGSLKEWLAGHGGKAPTFEVAAELAMGLLAGLEHLHVRGIVHRDLKPANVLMQGECPRIADFGLARPFGPSLDTGAVAGTVAYMAPEAFDGARTVATDLWAVGVILHQLLSGALPYSSPNGVLGVMKLIATTDPAPLPDSVPVALRAVVRTALDRNPAGRHRSAADMRAALRDALRKLEASTALAPPRAVRTVAVTGSMLADPRTTARAVRTVLAPYLGASTTWYCGTDGNADEAAAAYLLGAGQRVIGVGYGPGDISGAMERLLGDHGAPFADAHDEPVPPVPNAPSRRDVFFATKADLVVVFWDGHSTGAGRLIDWLRGQGKDHLVGFV